MPIILRDIPYISRSVILIVAEMGADCLYSIKDITTKLVCSYEKFCQN